MTTIHPGRNKQLFLDDDAIESKYGLRRKLNQPERVGAIIRPDFQRGQGALQTASPPQWNPEKGVWEWWYRASQRNIYDKNTVHYAVSTDGLEWEIPNLGLYEWNGSRDNNVAVDPGGMTLDHALRDELDEDPDRRYKGLFADRGLARYPATSPDGFDWTMIDVPPIPSDDTSFLTHDETTGLFVATVKLSLEKWGRSVWLSTSNDFIDWTEPELIFHTDEKDRNNRRRRIRQVVDDPAYLSPHVVEKDSFIAHVYKMAVMPYEGLYVGLPVLFNPSGRWLGRNHTGLNQVELSVSRDLRHWDRVANRDVFIGVLPWDGEVYDTSQLLPCGRPVVREDLGEIWVYYNACRFRCHRKDRDESFAKYFDDLSALSLAKIRLDGFVSLDADTKGTLVTAPFALDRGGLYVNVDARRGELRAEVVDAETFDPVPGLSLSDCDGVRGDDLARQLTWGERGAPARDRQVRLRFELSQARLYAFWMGPRP